MASLSHFVLLTAIVSIIAIYNQQSFASPAARPGNWAAVAYRVLHMGDFAAMKPSEQYGSPELTLGKIFL